jgi:CRISPR-associated endonuclease/helicase Cas3
VTSEVLVRRADRPVSIPGDVQQLVEEVHGHQADTFCWDDPAQSAAYSAYRGKETAQRSVGDLLVIPRARSVAGLDGLHHLEGGEDEWEASTRLGADAVRLLCVYAHTDGTLTLDAKGTQPLPGIEEPLTRADVKTVMARTIPVNATWFQNQRYAHQPPEKWAEHPMLGDLLVLAQPVIDGMVQPVAVGGKHLHLDAELGLVRA